MHGTIKITLKSDTAPGAGTSLAGVVDAEVCFDEYGLPYIPAKRLRGVLREVAENLLAIGALSGNLETLFGKESDTGAGALTLDNGRIEYLGKLEDFLAWAQTHDPTIFSRHRVIAQFSSIRSQTRIHAQKRTAARNSLRMSRVLNKGISFVFPVNLPENCKDAVERICKKTTALGCSVHRGWGEVQTELLVSDTATKTTPTVQQVTANQRLRLEFTNQGPLLNTIRPGAGQVSDSFVAGTAIWGAMATAYIKGNGIDEDFKRIFMDGAVSFSHALPSHNGKRFTPTPLSLKGVKSDPRNLTESLCYDHSQLDDENGQSIRESVVFKGRPGEFCILEPGDDDTTIKALSPARIATAHHQRPQNRAIGHATQNDGAFFQFEALAPGQTFQATIEGPAELLSKLVLPEDESIRLGKSRSTEYGHCCLTSHPEVATMESLKIEANDEATIICESDCLLLNGNGFPDPSPEQLLQHITKRANNGESNNLEIKASFAATQNVGGFLGIWKLPRPQTPALAAGSVITIRNPSEQALTIDLSQPFGLRTNEGFGVIREYQNDNAPCNPSPLSQGTANKPTDLAASQDLAKALIRQTVRQDLIKKARENAAKARRIDNHVISRLLAMLDGVSMTNGCGQNETIGSIFAGHVSNFKDTARESVIKITKDLYLRKSCNDFAFDSDAWESTLGQCKNLIRDDGLKTHIDGMQNDSALYREYIRALLIAQKRHNRKADEQQKTSTPTQEETVA